MALGTTDVVPLPHHEQNVVCSTRPAYRESRRHLAVKVYTISCESKYLLIQGVPAVGVRDELGDLSSQYGELSDIYPLDGYPCEEFTETYLLKFARIQSARVAKRRLDDKSFFGGVLHVCYAPEFETVQETREKLGERQHSVMNRMQHDFKHKGHRDHYSSSKKIDSESAEPSLPSSSGLNNFLVPTPPAAPMTYIWAGREYVVEQPQDPSPEEPVESPAIKQPTMGVTSLIPRQLVGKRKAEHSKESFDSTASSIRSKLIKVNVPSMEVSLRRKNPQ